MTSCRGQTDPATKWRRRRMLHRFRYNGRDWQAETRGMSHEVLGLHSVGAWFTCDSTKDRIYGSLNPVDVQGPTDARMIDALETTLKRQSGPAQLTIHATMWSRDVSVMTLENPVQYEVRGMPPGLERI